MAADADKMQVDDANSTLSSSPISSAPLSPHNNGDASDTIRVTQPVFSSSADRGGVANSTSLGATAAPPQAATSKNTTQLDKPKRPRKKKEAGTDAIPDNEGKPKVAKPRKPREPKEKPNGTITAVKTKKKTETDKPVNTIESMINAMPTKTLSMNVPATQDPIPRPVTSGQKYDPIRGMTMDVRPPPPIPQSHNRVTVSSSIASLIDPPVITTTTTSTTPSIRSPQTNFNTAIPKSSPPLQSPTLSKVSAVADGAMDIDENSPSSKLAVVKTASKVSSSTQTPKISRSSPPAPKGKGSGLLSSSDLFGGPNTASSERHGVNIDIHIKLDPNGGNHINIAQEIIKKYGRDALNPRAAQHRERLAQVLAAANKIEAGVSADDMSIDLMSDMGDDSNIEMGGTAEDSEQPRKRRKKTEDYDFDDDFIDDTELAWQQQAAVAKDGFFVYSGPLVPEGETARVEAANAGARSKAPRSKAPRKTAATASLAKKEESGAPSPQPSAAKPRARPKAPAAPRKKPAPKADKEKEAEKAKAALTASTLPVPPPLPAPGSAPGTMSAAV